MKTLVIALGILLLNGCATTWIYEDTMQPDGSYKIVGGGNGYASSDRVKNSVTNHATNLCPNGFDTKSLFCDNAFKPSCTTVVKCSK